MLSHRGVIRSATFLRLAVAFAVTAVLTLLAIGSANGQDADGPRTYVPGAKTSIDLARVSQKPTQGVDLSVVMRLRNTSRLDSFNEAVADPTSPSYGDYLTPVQFHARYSPTEESVSAVKRWIESQGLEVVNVSGNRTLIDVSGPASSAERAFRTNVVSGRTAGMSLTAATTPLSVPSELAPSILSVVGLDGVTAKPLAAKVPPPPVFRNARPCSRFWAQKYAKHAHKVKNKKGKGKHVVGLPDAYGQRQPWAVCGYTPRQIQGAYGVMHNVRNGLAGQGQTVAIIDAFASPTIRRDLRIYSARHGLPKLNFQQRTFKGPCPKCSRGLRQGWYGEQTLDFDAVHTMAPKAKIYYGGAANPGPGLLRVLNYVIDRHKAQIVTNSYGALGEQTAQIVANEQAYRQAIAEGIGVYFSSGDDGNERDTIGYVSADYSASSPRVTAVGGTTLGIGPLNNFRFELGWQTDNATLEKGRWSPKPPGDFYYGSGGQVSRLFAQPPYQRGVVPRGIASIYGGKGRALPDISMLGDPTTGLIVGETEQFPSGKKAYIEARFGGTSLSSPLFAGYMALADQLSGYHHGFVNPAIYQAYNGTAIRDIKQVKTPIAAVKRDFKNGFNGKQGYLISLRTVGRGPPLASRNGYDLSTGLGSPRGDALLYALRGR